jgi:hypothetical protein
MRALSPRFHTALVVATLVGCGPAVPPPVTVQVGVHRVSFAVPDGFVHYDHGREQRLERTEGDLVITDLGPVTTDGYRRVIDEARGLSRAGQPDDAATLLRDLRLWTVFSDDETTREVLQTVDRIANSRSETEVETAFDSLEGLVGGLPPPVLRELAYRALDDLDHDDRRDIEREARLHLGGRDALQITTWQRLTHDLRRRHIFVLDRGNLLVIRTDMGRDEVLGPAFEELRRSFSFADDATVTGG